MKTFILITLFAFNAFAGEFVTEELITSKTSDYKTPAHLTIEVVSLNSHERTAEILINGQLISRPVFLHNIVNENDQSRYTYNVEFLNSSYHAGSCDEVETFKSLLSFDVIVRNTDEEFNNLKYKTTYRYSFDNCHDFNPETKTIIYKQVQTL